MTILDRYILKSFFFNLVLWCVCIIGIYIVFDLFTNLDALLKAGKELGSVPKVIATFYLFKSIPIAMMLSSILGLISAMITVAMMMRNNELVPIQAAGISTIRIIRPLFFAVVFVAIGACVLREAVLPHYIDELVMDVGDFSSQQGTMLNATIDNETGISIMGEETFRKEFKISKPNFVIPKPILKQVTSLKAEEAFWHKATKDRPAGFMLVGMTEKPAVVNGSGLVYNEKTILITHQAAPEWVEPGNCFIVSNVPFDFLVSNNAWRENASTLDLIRAARNKSLDVGNRVHATIHSRLLQPWLDVTILFLGLPVILVSGDRNVFKAMGLSGLTILAFLVVQKGCQYVGAYNDMPVLGSWLPLLIFGPIAVNQFLLLRTR